MGTVTPVEGKFKGSKIDFMDQELIKTEIRKECAKNKLDLTLPENAFIVAKWTPQGWLVNPFSELHVAEDYARKMDRIGNTEIYVMSANPQHGLQKMVTANLLFVE